MPAFLFRPALVALVLFTHGCGPTVPDTATDGKSSHAEEPNLAYVTNGVAEFWTVAATGAQHAGRDLQVKVTVMMPNGLTDQTRKIEDLLTRGSDGIAVSPIDADNQIDVLNRAAQETNLITHDSDAPASNRMLYIGMDNYDAGRMCGDLVRQAVPDGGDVMILIGRTDQDNAKRRRQGCIDAILGRTPDPSRHDPSGEILESEDGKYRVLGTLTDQFDRAKAKANAEDTLTRYPDIAAMVGLFVYNPPQILEAIDRAGKLGKVKVIGFDEAEVTLQGIQDGTVFGTVAQDPYRYGYESIRVLNELHQGNTSVIPENKFIDIPATVVTQENVDAFWTSLKEKIGK